MYPRRRAHLVFAVGLLAVTLGSLHGTGALLGEGPVSASLLAAGVSGLVAVFAACSALPVEWTRRAVIRLFGLSVAIYVPWLVYALSTDARPVPADAVGATLTGLLVATVAATLAAGGVLLANRLELVLGWHDPPEKRLLSDEEYRAFREGQ